MALAFSMNTTFNTLPSHSRLKLVYAIASPRACHSKGPKWKNRVLKGLFFFPFMDELHTKPGLETPSLFYCPTPETRTEYRVFG